MALRRTALRSHSWCCKTLYFVNCERTAPDHFLISRQLSPGAVDLSRITEKPLEQMKQLFRVMAVHNMIGELTLPGAARTQCHNLHLGSLLPYSVKNLLRRL